MSLLPKEHGAYGQITFPLVTAFLVAGATTPGVLTALAVTATFVAHEPLLVVLGLRGSRARREEGRRATCWLSCGGAVALAAGVGAVVTAAPAIWWSFAVPLVPAGWLGVAIATGREKTWPGEVAAACAFSLVAVPVCLGGGATARTAFGVAIPFAFLFVSGTLAVRTVISRVRGGGNPHTTALLRRAVVGVALVGAAALAAAGVTRILPWAVLLATAPGLLVAVVVTMALPSPARLRTIGWTLVAASVLTALLIVLANRPVSAGT